MRVEAMRLGLIDPQLPAHLKTSYQVLVRGSARVAGPPCGVHPKKSAPCAVVGFSSRFPVPFHPGVMVLTSKRAWISECLGKNRLPKIICVLFMIHIGSVFMSELPRAFLDRPPLWWWFPTECGPQNWLATIKSSPVAVPHTLGSHGWLGTVDDQESIHALTISPCFSLFFRMFSCHPSFLFPLFPTKKRQWFKLFPVTTVFTIRDHDTMLVLLA